MANRFLSNIRINDAYTFPASDGTAGQSIVTDGAGNLSFSDISAGDSFATILIDDFTGDGATVNFTLAQAVDNEVKTFVFLNGVYQFKDTYSISGTTVTFSAAPADGTAIEVITMASITSDLIYQDNFTANGVLTEFTLANPVDNEVKTFVFLDGVYQFKDTYSLDGSTVVFSTAPTNGTEIEVISISSVPSDTYTGSLYFYGKATEAINKGDAIMFAGVQGDHFLISKATQAAIGNSHELFLGLASQSLSIGEFGYVTEFGRIDGLDTTVWTAGDILWFDSGGATAGALTTTEPAAPLAKIQVAVVVREHQTQGVLFIRPTTYHELGELHDVNIVSVADNDILTWNAANGYWENGNGLANASNWDTAYGWGDHASAGYAEDYTTSYISVDTTATAGNLYVFTATLTLTLPASPTAGDKVAISNMSGTTTPVIARNGNLIAGLAEDFTVDVANIGLQFIYSGATKGWILI